jgi:hypothetical protein
MRAKKYLMTVAGIACSALVITSVALAAGAKTTITLVGPDSVHGTIHSTSTSCLGGRKVVVYMQKGDSQDPSTDQKMNTTTSSREGNHGVWDMGNPGFPKHKKYYAVAKRKTGCKAGFSPTERF